MITITEDFYKESTDPHTGKKTGVVDARTGVEERPILSPEFARELAEVEANLGRDKALAREQELKRLHETGLTDRERDIVAFNEGLVAMYPHAFAVDIGKDGKVYYEVKRDRLGVEIEKNKKGLGNSVERVILTPDGIFIVGFRGMDNDIPRSARSNTKETNTYYGEQVVRDLSPSRLFLFTREEAKNGGVDISKAKDGSDEVLELASDLGVIMPITYPGEKYERRYHVRLIDPLKGKGEWIQSYKMRLDRIEKDNKEFDGQTLKGAEIVTNTLERFKV